MVYAPEIRSNLLCKIAAALSIGCLFLAVTIVTSNIHIFAKVVLGIFFSALALYFYTEVRYFKLIFKKPCVIDKETGILSFPNELGKDMVNVDISKLVSVRVYYNETFRLPSCIEFKTGPREDETMNARGYSIRTLELMLGKILEMNENVYVIKNYEFNEETGKTTPLKTPVR